MKAILICPEHRATGGIFHRMQPLALMPVLGRSVLDHTLCKLKKDGIEQVIVLASDRPEVIREAVDKGRAWGLQVEVIATTHELAPDAAELQYGSRAAGEARPRVIVLDTLPGLPGKTLWQTNFATFEAIHKALLTPEIAAALTMREVMPDVWVSTRAAVSSMADITGPAWIGPHASVGPEARIGPNAIIEGGAFVDGGATIESAWIGPGTYVGATAMVRESCAWGDGLLNCSDGTFFEVRDSFLLHDLTHRTASQCRAGLIERVVALTLMLITVPRALWVMQRSRSKMGEVFNEKRVILPPPHCVDAFTRTFPLLRMKGATGLFQRWPELWSVVRGDMALVGNRPLSLEETTALNGPMAQLWLESPAGVFSLADAEGADGECISESLGHAAYFSAKRSIGLRLRVLCRCLKNFILPVSPAESLPLHLPAQSL